MSGYLMEVPLEDGNSVVVEIAPDDDLVLAAPKPGAMLGKASQTLESALAKIDPAMRSIAEWMRRSGPDEATVEFGLKLGGQSSVIIASGKAEVNFVVKLTWKK